MDENISPPLIDAPDSKAKTARRTDDLLGYVNPYNTMSYFMGIPKEILKQGFILNYRNLYQQDTAAVFLPNEHETSKWDVYQCDDWGYKKYGEMPMVKASNLDIIRLASGEEPHGRVVCLKPTGKDRGISR